MTSQTERESTTNSTSFQNRKTYYYLIGLIVALAQVVGCSKGYVGKTFVSNSGRYIKFIDDKTLEWDMDYGRREVFDYSLEKDRIRSVRRFLGLGQIFYFDIDDENTLSDEAGNKYHFQPTN